MQKQDKDKISGEYKVTYKQKDGIEADYVMENPIYALHSIFDEATKAVRQRKQEEKK